MPPFRLHAHATRTVVPVRFRSVGDPFLQRATLSSDTRGWSVVDAFDSHWQGSLICMRAGTNVPVRLERMSLGNSATLTVNSSDTSIVMVSPTTLSGASHHTLTLNAMWATGAARYAVITVEQNGHVLHRLHVWVFPPLLVRVSIHKLGINAHRDGEQYGIFPELPNGDPVPAETVASHNVLGFMRALWEPYGIDLQFRVTERSLDFSGHTYQRRSGTSETPTPLINGQILLYSATDVSLMTDTSRGVFAEVVGSTRTTDLERITSAAFDSGRINIYLVRDVPDLPEDTYAYTFQRGIPNPSHPAYESTSTPCIVAKAGRWSAPEPTRTNPHPAASYQPMWNTDYFSDPFPGETFGDNDKIAKRFASSLSHEIGHYLSLRHPKRERSEASAEADGLV